MNIVKGFCFLKIKFRGQPCGIVAKFICSASASLQIWILGVDLHVAHQATLWQHPTYKIEEDWHRFSSGTIFLSKKTTKNKKPIPEQHGTGYSLKCFKKKYFVWFSGAIAATTLKEHLGTIFCPGLG